MTIENLIKENPGINLTVNAGELMEFGIFCSDRSVIPI